jgi:uncharacterized membrane protein YdjX (TVP38/TMEM64 family)
MKKEKIINWSLAVVITSLLVFTLISFLKEGTVYHLFKGNTQVLSEMISGSALAVILFILLIAVEVVVAPIPALVLYVAGGIMFGPLLGGFYSILGNILGAALAFFMAKYWLRGYFEKRISIKMRNKFDKFSLKHGPLAIFLLRINPLTSSDLFSYIAGLSKINFWKFILWTGLGLAPLVYAQTYAGDALSASPFLVNMFMLISALYVLGFTVIFIYLQWKKNNKEKKKENAKLPHKK